MASSEKSARAAGLLALVSTGLVSTGCTEEFASPALLSGLRVLAVEASPPSGVPGEAVALSIVLDDATPEGSGSAHPRPLEIAWLGGCHNPPGGYYLTCAPGLLGTASQLSKRVLSTPPGKVSPAAFGIGETFSVPIPTEILETRPRDPAEPLHYGVSFAFFAACAGELRSLPRMNEGLPLQCVVPGTDEPAPPSDYETGFTTIYTFEGEKNDNPVIESVALGGERLESRECKMDRDCRDLGKGRFDYACTLRGTCAPVVAACRNGKNCAGLRFEPEVSRASAEKDPSALLGDGTALREILWIDYFTTAGSLSTASALVHDRQTGWQGDVGATWVAPAQPSDAVRLWAVLRDNRGGTAWAKVDVIVR